MTIRAGTHDDISQCAACLSDSRLGGEYFADPDYTRGFIEQAVLRGELTVVVPPTDPTYVAGFMRIDPTGMFSRFPLLRLIAVAPDHRGRGYGSHMLRYYEDKFFQPSGKLFLAVSDFNDDARRLYEKHGYVVSGRIPELYKPGVAELLMLKQSPAEP